MVTSLVTVLVVLLVGLALRLPVALVLAVAGIGGLAIENGWEAIPRSAGSIPFSAASRYTLVVIPMFVLMGMFILKAGVIPHVFTLAKTLLRWLPGGLGVATVATCAGFAAVTGSSVATVATLGRLTVTQMVKEGYRPSFAAGILGAGGTLGILIPPSIPLVIYGILTGVSVGHLLVAALVPGVLTAVVYGLFIVVRVKLNPALLDSRGVSADTYGDVEDADRGSSIVAQLVSSLCLLFIFVVVIGGIYSGVFTATESGALGAVAALAVLLGANLLSPRRLWVAFRESISATGNTVASIFAILIGASFLSAYLVAAGIPSYLANEMVNINVSPKVLVLILLVLLLPLGMFLDTISILVIVVPLVYPTFDSLGVEGIWLGILIVKMIEIGLITPPVGMNAFVLVSAVKKIRLETVFVGLWPFVVVELTIVGLLFLVPGLTMIGVP